MRNGATTDRAARPDTTGHGTEGAGEPESPVTEKTTGNVGLRDAHFGHLGYNHAVSA